jgi:hypothetical protein
MKKLILILSLIWLGGCSEAQTLKESQVPAEVTGAFHKIHPELKEYKWFLEDGNYEAEYHIDKMEAAVTFDTKGNLVETEKEIPVKDLPPAIADYVSKNYSGASIKEASEITNATGVKTFEAEIKGKDLVFDEKGNFLKEEKD